MQIITNVTPTKELEAAVAAELKETKDKPEIAIANLLGKAKSEEQSDEPSN